MRKFACITGIVLLTWQLCGNASDTLSAAGGAKMLRVGQAAMPAELIVRGIEGCVVISFQLDQQGKATDFHVLDSQPPGVFDRYALQTMASTVFAPGQPEGRYAAPFEVKIEEADSIQPFTPCIAAPTYDQLNKKQ